MISDKVATSALNHQSQNLILANKDLKRKSSIEYLCRYSQKLSKRKTENEKNKNGPFRPDYANISKKEETIVRSEYGIFHSVLKKKRKKNRAFRLFLRRACYAVC